MVLATKGGKCLFLVPGVKGLGPGYKRRQVFISGSWSERAWSWLQKEAGVCWRHRLLLENIRYLTAQCCLITPRSVLAWVSEEEREAEASFD